MLWPRVSPSRRRESVKGKIWSHHTTLFPRLPAFCLAAPLTRITPPPSFPQSKALTLLTLARRWTLANNTIQYFACHVQRATSFRILYLVYMSFRISFDSNVVKCHVVPLATTVNDTGSKLRPMRLRSPSTTATQDPATLTLSSSAKMVSAPSTGERTTLCDDSGARLMTHC